MGVAWGKKGDSEGKTPGTKKQSGRDLSAFEKCSFPCGWREHVL